MKEKYQEELSEGDQAGREWLRSNVKALLDDALNHDPEVLKAMGYTDEQSAALKNWAEGGESREGHRLATEFFMAANSDPSHRNSING